jgi:hypothetical protein
MIQRNRAHDRNQDCCNACGDEAEHWRLPKALFYGVEYRNLCLSGACQHGYQDVDDRIHRHKANAPQLPEQRIGRAKDREALVDFLEPATR